jgi:hypothetical protein
VSPEWIAHFERAGGWVAVTLGGFILRKLHTVSVQFDGIAAKWTRAEKKISYADGKLQGKSDEQDAQAVRDTDKS